MRRYGEYVAASGQVPVSAPELRARTLAKRDRGVFEEVRPLLRDGIHHDTAEAAEWFEAEIISRLRNDDGTRALRRPTHT